MSKVKVKYSGGVLQFLDFKTGSAIPTVERNQTIEFSVSSNVWNHVESIRLFGFRAWEDPPSFNKKSATDWNGKSVVLEKGTKSTLDLPTKYGGKKHRMIAMNIQVTPAAGPPNIPILDPWDESPG